MKLIKRLNEFTNIIDEEKSYIMIKDKSYHIEIANKDFILTNARIESEHVLSPHIIVEVESTKTGVKKSLIVYEGDKHYIRLLCLDSLSAITTIEPNNKNIELFMFYEKHSNNDDYTIIKKGNFTQIIDMNKVTNEITNDVLWPNKILSIEGLNYRLIEVQNNPVHPNSVILKLYNTLTEKHLYMTIILSDFKILETNISYEIIETNMSPTIGY